MWGLVHQTVAIEVMDHERTVHWDTFYRGYVCRGRFMHRCHSRSGQPSCESVKIHVSSRLCHV